MKKYIQLLHTGNNTYWRESEEILGIPSCPVQDKLEYISEEALVDRLSSLAKEGWNMTKVVSNTATVSGNSFLYVWEKQKTFGFTCA